MQNARAGARFRAFGEQFEGNLTGDRQSCGFQYRSLTVTALSSGYLTEPRL
jgi:hypothetical protein